MSGQRAVRCAVTAQIKDSSLQKHGRLALELDSQISFFSRQKNICLVRHSGENTNDRGIIVISRGAAEPGAGSEGGSSRGARGHQYSEARR